MAEQKIGRFEIVGELGKGGQGAVYLAHDPQLDRQVAIKTLRNMGRNTERLLHEARIVSKLQHPNIVALYDAGEYQGNPYLVYAYIAGQTLAQKLKREKSLSFVEAAEITCGVLDGLAYAHAQGVMHLDIKPANLMLGSGGLPMVMDFGLAQADGEQGKAIASSIDGTPHYMAPERISGKQADLLSDIYSVGVMLYEMVTGELAFDGESVYAVLNRAAHETVVAPSERNERVDEELEAIILKAIARNPEDRYQSAPAMKQALQTYLGKAHQTRDETGQKAHSTLEFMLRRMRSKSDFPALSNVISEINRIVSSDSESPAKLARVILQDFALTNKVLRLVNTVSYGQFGGSINTISKAVMIMGFDPIRNIAMTLILLEFMKNKSQSAQLKDEVVAAIFSGIVTAQLSVGKNIRDAEVAMVCSMFHNFGRILTTFYFFDESQEILRLAEQGVSEENAALKVLGISYPELGQGVAKSWNFSPRLMAGMRKLSGEKVREPQSDLDYLMVTVNMANELCAVAASASVEDKEQSLRKLSERYRGAIRVSAQEMNGALDRGLDEMSRRSAILGISPSKSALLKKVRKWSGFAAEAEQKQEPEQQRKDRELDSITNLDLLVEHQAKGKEDTSDHSPEDILGAGIQDVTTSLVGEFNLSDLLQMVLETMYRGMGFNRALIMIRDNRMNAMSARMGFGADIETLIPRFRFPIAAASDVFQLAIGKGADILIENTQAPNIADKIPVWYRSTIDAPCFMLLPVMVKDKAIALFYADMLEASSLNISKQQLSLLRTLRNQAVLAIRQKV